LTSLVSHRFSLEDINEGFEKSDWLGDKADKSITRAVILP
jgi:Zn-dependent alcohol dehydrogenase